MKKNKIFSIIIIFFLLSITASAVSSTEPTLFDIGLNYGSNPPGWSAIEVITPGYHDNYMSQLVVDDDNTVHAVLAQNNDVIYRFKPANGNWSPSELVTSETNSSYSPSIAIDGLGNIHIAWIESYPYQGSGWDDDICYKMRTIEGNWTVAELVTPESNDNIFAEDPPALAVDSFNKVHIAWAEDTNYSDSGDDLDIFYKTKLMGGDWAASPVELVSVESTETSWSTSLNVDIEGNVHVVWSDYTDILNCGEDQDIFYREKPQGSHLWEMTEVVSTESIGVGFDWGSANPEVLVDDQGTVHVVWDDDSPNLADSGWDTDIFYKQKQSSEAWEDNPTECASPSVYLTSAYPSFSLDSNGKIHICWANYWSEWRQVGIYQQGGTPHYTLVYRVEVFYNVRSSAGSWNIRSPVMISQDGDPWGFRPTLASGSDHIVHLAWTDQSNFIGCGDDADIFYRSSSKLLSEK